MKKSDHPVVSDFEGLPAIRSGHNDSYQEFSASEPRRSLSMLDVVQLIWGQRRFVGRFTLTSLVLFTLLAFLLPKHYIATTRLMPPDYGSNLQMALALPALSQGAGAAGGASGAGSSIMSMAGQLLGLSTSGDLFIGVIQSDTVGDHIIQKFNLMKLYRSRYLVDAREALEKRTEAKSDRKTGIISISVEDKSPELAAAIAREYVKELDLALALLNTSAAHRERIFIEGRIKGVKEELDASAKDFATFSSENAAIDVPEQAKAMVTAAADLQAQLIAAQSELRGLQEIYTDNNVRIKALKAHVDELQRQVNKFGGINTDPNKDTRLAKGELYPSIRQLPLVGVRYLDLYRRTKVNEGVFEFLTKEYEIAKVEEARELPSVQVLDPAIPPDKKSSPHRLALMLIGVFFGLVFASVCVVAKATWEVVDPGDPRKILALDVFHTVRRHTWETGVVCKIRATCQQIAERFHRHGNEDDARPE